MSIGESLADARVRAGLTVGQVSQQTRIRESIIRDIEQGDFDACGGDFYARGHIRSIAGVVGTDPVPLISEYDADHGPVGPLRAADVFGPAKPIKIRERRSPSLAMIVVLVLLAIIGYGSYRLVSGHGKSTGHPVAAAATTAPPAHAEGHALALRDALGRGDQDRRQRGVLGRADHGQQRVPAVHGGHRGGQLDDMDGEAGGEPAAGQSRRDRLTVDGQHHGISTAQPVTLNFSPQAGSSVSTSDSVSSGSQAG